MNGGDHHTLGWISQFAMSAGIHRRIVLYGNVLDYILDDSRRTELEALPLVTWLIHQLRNRGYQRIVLYDCDED
ncbi:MAG: hypothetical protein KKA60_08895, partial [Proteobacteria bacterium]|nr:hypothetical protein [Pseudomonadota bacterium]